MTERITWKQRLDPFARVYCDLINGIENDLKEMDDAELAKLAAACTKPNQGNCWWATFNVAPLVAEEVNRQRYERRKAKSEERKAARAASTDGVQK